jgi:hypothetical protein
MGCGSPSSAAGRRQEQVPGERGHPAALERRHRHHHMLGLEPPLARGHHISVPLPREPVHRDAAPNRQLEARGVGLEVGGHLVLRGKRALRGWERHPVEAVEASGREQPERVPALPPRVAHSRVGVEDHERETSPSQVVPDREARLAASDDDRLNAFLLARAVHASPPGGPHLTNARLGIAPPFRSRRPSVRAGAPAAVLEDAAACRRWRSGSGSGSWKAALEGSGRR